jgi:hypothetical protein
MWGGIYIQGAHSNMTPLTIFSDQYIDLKGCPKEVFIPKSKTVICICPSSGRGKFDYTSCECTVEKECFLLLGSPNQSL